MNNEISLIFIAVPKRKLILLEISITWRITCLCKIFHKIVMDAFYILFSRQFSPFIIDPFSVRLHA